MLAFKVCTGFCSHSLAEAHWNNKGIYIFLKKYRCFSKGSVFSPSVLKGFRGLLELRTWTLSLLRIKEVEWGWDISEVSSFDGKWTAWTSRAK